MRARPDGCRDEPDLEAEGRDQPQSAEARSVPCAWDASDGVRLDEAADAPLPLRALLADADAGKSAGQGQDAQAQGAPFLSHRLALSAPPDAAAVLYTLDAVQSAERSCAAQEAAAGLRQPEEPRDAVPPAGLAAQPKQSWAAQVLAVVRQPEARAAVPDAAPGQSRLPPEPLAFQPAEQPQVAAEPRESRTVQPHSEVPPQV